MPLDPTPPLERPIPPARDWLTAPRKDLIAHIISHHHGFAREELARLAPLLDEACATCLEAHPELAEVRIHFRELGQDLRGHFQMEERNLFPAICAMDDGAPAPIALGSPREQLSSIHAEHQAVEELFLNIRMLTADYGLAEDAPAPLAALYLGLRGLEDDLHIHLYLENHLLFPRVLQGVQW
jgi:regulator of cell morphogenesis and NO signaling